MEITLDGPSARWVPRGGRPADVIWGASHREMPSYESETGTLQVYNVLIAFFGNPAFTAYPGFAGATVEALFAPRDYNHACTRSVLAGGADLTCLHDAPDAVWSWRPLLYRFTERDGANRLGSQQELAWRRGLAEAEASKADLQDALDAIAQACLAEGVGFAVYRERALAAIDAFYASPPPLPYLAANERAGRLLRAHLAPQQQFDLDVRGYFFVRGVVNRLYKIELGNGCAIVDPLTHDTIVSVCLHPEEWLPDADVALATKLLIEAGKDGERELLEGGRPTPWKRRRRATRDDREAWAMERALLPAPALTTA